MNKLRVFLADDHAVISEGLRLLVNSQPDMEVVGDAVDGREALARVRELLSDVAVLDISMPVMNGLRATEQIRQHCLRVKVLTLTRHADDDVPIICEVSLKPLARRITPRLMVNAQGRPK